MPKNTVTLAALISQVRQRADMESSTFVSDSEIRTWLNSALAELHDIMVMAFEDYYVKTKSYTLPGIDGAEVLTGSITPFFSTVGQVTGSGTSFLTELAPGDQITVTSQLTNQLTGSIDTAGGTTTVNGVGTKFTTELEIGQDLIVGVETRTVATIIDDTELTTTVAFSDLASTPFIYSVDLEATAQTKEVQSITSDTNLFLTDSFLKGLIDSSPDKVIPSGQLPDDFYKVLGVDFDGGGVTTTVTPYSFAERNIYRSNASLITGTGVAIRYHVQDSLIKFIPSNSTSGTITLHYIPECQQFRTDGTDDTVPLNLKHKSVANGYQEFAVVTATIKCLLKEESDTRMLVMEKVDIQRRIQSSASIKDAGAPKRIIDASVGTRALL